MLDFRKLYIPLYSLLAYYVYSLAFGIVLPKNLRYLPFFIIFTLLFLNALVVYIYENRNKCFKYKNGNYSINTEDELVKDLEIRNISLHTLLLSLFHQTLLEFSLAFMFSNIIMFLVSLILIKVKI